MSHHNLFPLDVPKALRCCECQFRVEDDASGSKCWVFDTVLDTLFIGEARANLCKRERVRRSSRYRAHRIFSRAQCGRNGDLAQKFPRPARVLTEHEQNRLTCINRTSAADRYDMVSACVAECLHTRAYARDWSVLADIVEGAAVCVVLLKQSFDLLNDIGLQ